MEVVFAMALSRIVLPSYDPSVSISTPFISMEWSIGLTEQWSLGLSFFRKTAYLLPSLKKIDPSEAMKDSLLPYSPASVVWGNVFTCLTKPFESDTLRLFGGWNMVTVWSWFSEKTDEGSEPFVWTVFDLGISRYRKAFGW